MFLNSKKSTRPSLFRSTEMIILSTLSISPPSGNPSFFKTACNSLAQMNPSPFSSNTLNASARSDSSAAAGEERSSSPAKKQSSSVLWREEKSSKLRPVFPGWM
ncbi:hypothetical protein BRARA_H01045 [Brassica rapa]|uniref:Uncharacterized protein n=1 Tax=Brassica campestris TaxID=3711 RepID=A0A397YHY0_BRACM|nr:hypothetical protein BRARA_H01045 [Brassica rapa]